MFEFKERDENDTQEATGRIESQLRQWPIQLHLISPLAPYYQGADVLLTADCVAYALGDFHGLINLAQQASLASERKVPIKQVVVGVQGEILQEEWV
jgi:hypothetical protein